MNCQITNFDYIYRHYRYEQKLQSIMWKVDIREVTFLGTDFNEETCRIGNVMQLLRHRTMSLIGGDVSRRAYTTIGEKHLLLCFLQK